MYCDRLIKFTIPALCLLALFACKPAAEKKEGKPLAEVNGKVITVDDFKAEVDNLPPYIKPMAQSQQGKKELLESMIVRQLILDKANKEGIADSKEVTAKLEDLKKRVIVETYLKKKIEQDVKVSDAEMKQFYDQNKEKFKSTDQVHASHILVKSEKEAQDIQAQLKKGAKFEDLAKKYSADSSAAKGGDLGWFGKGAMVPEFEKTAFSLKEGEVSDIVKTPYGFHLIKVTGKRPAGIRSFDEVKDQIKAALLPAKQQELFQKMREEVKKDAKINIKEDVLASLDGKSEAAAPTPAAAPAPAPKK